MSKEDEMRFKLSLRIKRQRMGVLATESDLRGMQSAQNVIKGQKREVGLSMAGGRD